MANATPQTPAQVVTQPVKPISYKELGKILSIGAVVGLITAALYYIFKTYVFSAIFCGNQLSSCGSSMYISSATATIIGGIVALFALVQQRIYRPLLIVLFVSASLWNTIALVTSFPWFAVALSFGVLFALAYGAFSWIVQIRRFVVALIIGVVLTALIRILIVV